MFDLKIEKLNTPTSFGNILAGATPSGCSLTFKGMENVSSVPGTQWYWRMSVAAFTGFDSPAAIVTTAPSATANGERIVGVKIDKRTIVVVIALEGNVQSARQRIYAICPPAGAVRVSYAPQEADAATVSADGVVQNVQVGLWEKKQSVTVTIVCPEPFLIGQEQTENFADNHAHTAVVADLRDVKTASQTPVVIEFTKAANTSSYGFRVTFQTVDLDDEGDDVVTLSGTLTVGGTAQAPVTNFPVLQQNDKFRISSVSGDVSVIMTRDGSDIDLTAYSVATGGLWPCISRGDSKITLFMDGSASDFSLAKVTFSTSHLGV